MKELTIKQQELLHFILKADEQGMPRLQAFEKYAKLNNLKSETIRNQYYSLVKEFQLTKQFSMFIQCLPKQRRANCLCLN